MNRIAARTHAWARPARAARLACLSIAAASALVAFSGCATADMKAGVLQTAQETRKGPAAAPERTITSFSEALRCMDNLFIQYGIRDVSVLAEELEDKTKRVSAGTKEMLISATSSMTRRSRAIRLVTYGPGSNGLADWIDRSRNRLSPYADVPLFAIRGSVSQFDQNLAVREGDAGIAVGNLSAGGAVRASASRLAVDMNMIYGSNFSIVSGVTSHNSILLLNQGKGVDSDATIRKFGINFNLTMSSTDGQAQGLRTLVDLAAIELYGRLSRTPYWSCIGSPPEEPEVAKEIDDWYYSMQANGELIPYVQHQLRVRGWYGGPVNAQRSPALDDSVAQYRAALGGASGNGAIDIDFFRRYLSSDHAQVLAKQPPPAQVPGAQASPEPAVAAAPPAAAPTASAPPAAAAPADKGLQLKIESSSGEQVFSPGKPVQLKVMANQPAYLTCFIRDEARQIQRIFPNRFQRDSLIPQGQTLALPGAMRFEIIASPRGSNEAVVCYATERDVLAQLPRQMSGADFENLPVGSMDEIRNALRSLTHDRLAEGVFHVRTR